MDQFFEDYPVPILSPDSSKMAEKIHHLPNGLSEFFYHYFISSRSHIPIPSVKFSCSCSRSLRSRIHPPPWYFPFSTPLTVSITCGTDVKWEKNNENETKKKRGKVAKKRRGKNFLRHLPDWSTSLVTSTDNNGLKGRRGAGELDDATKRPLRSTSPSKFDSTFWLKRKRRGKKLASAENV